MKKKILICLFVVVWHTAFARTTYYPEYYAEISVTENYQTVSIRDSLPTLSINCQKGKWRFTILQEMVDSDKVRSIKHSKFNLGWASFNKGFAMARNSNQGITHYLEADKIEDNAVANVNTEMKLDINLLIENNSNEDLFVGDIAQGMSYWHVPAHKDLMITISKPDFMQLRATNCYPHDKQDKAQNVSYLTISAYNSVAKYNVAFENDSIMVVYKGSGTYNNYEYIPPQYIWVNKTDWVHREISADELKELKRKNKK